MVVAASGCSTSRHSVGYAPSLFGVSYVCLRGDGIAAADETHTYIPPGFPTSTSTTRPSRCFESVDEATRAGYRPPAPPPDTQLVDGTYLVPVAATLTESCQRAADRLRFAVPCPRLLPNPVGQPVSCVDDCVVAGRWFILSDTGFTKHDDTPAHLVVVGRTAPSPEDPTGCSGEQPTNTITVGSSTVRLVECPDASELLGGHTVARWDLNGVTVAVSVHGHSPHEHQLVEHLANTIQMVAPTN